MQACVFSTATLGKAGERSLEGISSADAKNGALSGGITPNS